MKLDPKLRTSCVEGISSFLSLFDMEDVADIFCPKAPAKERAAEGEEDGNGDSRPPVGKARMRRHLPPLDELIESGKVLALNMPAGSNPALARAIGVFLKNAWLQTLLRRPAQMKQEPERYFRPAVFICDEYQSFASVGEEDPSETRRRLPSPGSAASSPSSPPNPYPRSDPSWAPPRRGGRSCRPCAPGSSSPSATTPAPRSPRNSAGRWPRSSRAGPSPNPHNRPRCPCSRARPGASRGSVGTSKSFREQREALFQPREFGLLPNCQAICLPYDGTHATSAVRVYLKPYYLPVDTPYWRAVEKGKI